MNKTLRISFSLRNTYRVNAILYSLKQIPLVKKLLPEKLYGVRGLKIFANILAVIWEIISFFLGKFLYFLIMISAAGTLYEKVPYDRLFLHILLFLTVIGTFMNTNFFEATRDKYYAMILMRIRNIPYENGRQRIYAGQLFLCDPESDRRIHPVFSLVRVERRSSPVALPCRSIFCGRRENGHSRFLPVGI